MNTVAKGTRLEREFGEVLKGNGYVIHRTTRSQFHANDIWGCFDIMAKHPDKADFTLYFQISTQWKSGKALKEIEAFPAGMYDKVYLVRKKDRQPFELKIHKGGGIWRETHEALEGK